MTPETELLFGIAILATPLLALLDLILNPPGDMR